MRLRDDLIAAKALIDTPEKWLRGELADTRDTCFCAYGAAQFAGNGGKWSGTETAVTYALIEALPRGWQNRAVSKHRLAAFNDDPATTHADIIALFDRAIASASPADQQGGGE